ncbi:sensor histidine kinase [Paracidovorax valerianellae]|uniref:histidine kinase n=1 Tax=Paracidovorax valerianellae TaxID=187868 RepID=A0A1G6XPS2_9BURK|nr:HAMP domain-containing sensor histidine kinase [Paracidovorax valerianellae]MDA8443510.1 HAMP domain-containing histidine kinase [Paracidovorax valerianellae]SDD79753.1 Signal transduction histidine kinase [Paracidovorax valerianellae]
MRSLRIQLLLFWAFLLAACALVAAIIVVLYQTGSGAQVAASRTRALQACEDIATRYAKSVPTAAPEAPQADLLRVLLHVVLLEVPQVEGGVWSAGSGMLAYAYPTYEGSGVKADVPAAEAPLIVELAKQAGNAGQSVVNLVRGSREVLIVAACPLSAHPGTAVWTMTRAHAGAIAAQETLRIGIAVLALLVVASGAWLGWMLLRGLRQVRRLEGALADAPADAVPRLERTGIRELDRVVDGVNAFGTRLEEARARLKEALAQRHRDLRLTALGRMTASVAHEIRNPIAAMRLKAENALAAPPARHADALAAIVTQIDRLEGLVQSLLSLVQPLNLSPVTVPLGPWLQERLDTARPAAQARGVRLALQGDAAAEARFDPVHAARAIDNLLDNAVRHAPAGGQAVLSVQVDAARALCTLEVEDDGPGVPEDLQAQLFEPFATGRADGNGLGLALAREVALAHGGDLHYAPREGGGARFILELPWHAS